MDRQGYREPDRSGGGLILGDIILGVNGVRITEYNQLRDEVEKYKVGDTVTLTLLRDNRQVNVDVVLDAM